MLVNIYTECTLLYASFCINALSTEVHNSCDVSGNTGLPDQRIWTAKECADVFSGEVMSFVCLVVVSPQERNVNQVFSCVCIAHL